MLAVRIQIYQALEKWELMEVVAKKLVEYDPDDAGWWILWADAARRCNSVEAAHEILSRALKKFPDDAGVHFNLACYECLLGDMERAKDHLKKCFEIDPSWRITMLEDRRFEVLWKSI